MFFIYFLFYGFFISLDVDIYVYVAREVLLPSRYVCVLPMYVCIKIKKSTPIKLWKENKRVFHFFFMLYIYDFSFKLFCDSKHYASLIYGTWCSPYLKLCCRYNVICISNSTETWETGWQRGKNIQSPIPIQDGQVTFFSI